MPSIPGGYLLRSPGLLSLAAALWAAALGLLLAAAPMLILWLGSLDEGWRESLRLGGLLWLVGNGAAVSIAGITLTLLPWGLVVIPLVLLGYAGAWATRRSATIDPVRLLWIVIPGAVLYGALGAVVDVVVSEPASRVDLLHAALGCLVVATVGLGWGAVRGSGLLERQIVPRVLAVPVRAGAVALACVVGIGAVAATVSLVVHIDDAITMAQALNAGLGGGVGLLVLGIAYVPVMAVWGTAYVLGAGISLAPESTLSPFLASAAPVDLPAFPLLAALPGQAPPFAWLLPIVGVVGGVLAGVMIGRRLRHEQRLVRLVAAAGSAAFAGVGLWLLAWLSSGSLGTESLAHLGTDPLVLGVLGALLISVGAVPTALVPTPPARPSLAVAPVEESIPEPTPEPTPESVPEPITHSIPEPTPEPTTEAGTITDVPSPSDDVTDQPVEEQSHE